MEIRPIGVLGGKVRCLLRSGIVSDWEMISCDREEELDEDDEK